MNIELWKLVVSVGVALVAAVTSPIIWALRAEGKAIRADMATLKTELKGEISTARLELKAEIASAETRLNSRIDSWLVHR